MSKLSELVVKVTTALGADESKMRWRMHRLARWRTKSVRQAEAKSEKIRYTHKKCGACRALNDKDDKVCSSCGEPLRWRVTQMLERAGGGGFATTSALLIGCLLIANVIAIAQYKGPLEVRYFYIETIAKFVLLQGSDWLLLMLPFVHVSLVGLLATGLALFLLGQEIEALYGRFVMLTWFSITAFVGALAHHAMFDGFVFGASVGLCGLIGVGIAAGHKSGNHAGLELRNMMVKWGVIVFGVLLIMQGNIVGELVGAALGGLIGTVVPHEKTRRSMAAKIVLGSLGFGLVAAGTVLAITEMVPMSSF